MRYSNALLRLSYDMMQLGAEASSVMGLRMMKLAAGGAAASAEAELMVAEKLKALSDVQLQAWTSALTGSGHLAPQRAVQQVRRKVRANRRRLSR